MKRGWRKDMAGLAKYRVLILGSFSPLVALALVVCISYFAEHWSYRFGVPPLAILVTMLVLTALPFVVTVLFAKRDYRRQMLSLSGKIGIAIAVVSLIVPGWTAYGLFYWWRAVRNVELHGVPAPVFSTLDLNGVNRSLTDERGKVVLVNVWGTWCTACRAEMPELDRLYREHQDDGLVIFGLSNEDVATQKKCLEKIPVSYPLLTYRGQIPSLYRQVIAYPTTFFIDRHGNLQRGPQAPETFPQLEAAALALLHSEHEARDARTNAQ
jgi:thiol-disulfide isomerase/thioredoxin